MQQPEWMKDHSTFEAWRTAFWDAFSYTINGLAPYEEGERYFGEPSADPSERGYYGWRVTVQNAGDAVVIFAQRGRDLRRDGCDVQSWNVALGETYSYAAIEVAEWVGPRLALVPEGLTG